MTDDEIKALILSVLSRDLHLDLFDAVSARARQAHELIRDNTDLKGREARGLEGQARFRLMEKGFQDVCEKHGGFRLEGDLIPGNELRTFQPFMRFGGQGAGVILGLASMPAPRELPLKNRSRSAGVTLNYNLAPRLNLEGDGTVAQPGDVFVLLLCARDPLRAGHVEEVAIGVIDSKYKSFLAYEPIQVFLAGYAPPTPPEPPSDGTGAKLVKLKAERKPYRAPEQPDSDEDADGQAK